MWSSGPLRLSGYCGQDGRACASSPVRVSGPRPRRGSLHNASFYIEHCWWRRLEGWLAWLRDAERPRVEGRAAAVVPAAAAVSRRRPALPPERQPPERRRPRGEVRGRPAPAGPRATAGAGRPPTVPVRNRALVAAAQPAMARPVIALPAKACGVARGHRQPMVRAGRLGQPLPVEPVGPLGRRRPKDPGGPLPTEHAGLLVRPRPMVRAARLGHRCGRELARQRAGRSAPELAAPEPKAPARAPAPSAVPRPAARRRARPQKALASNEDRGPDPAQGREGIDGRPPVPHDGPGTGTQTGIETELLCAGGAPTGPPNAPALVDLAPPGPIPTDLAPRGPIPTDLAPQGLIPTDPAPRGPTPTDPAARGPDRITRRGAAPGYRRPTATARRTGPAKAGPARTGPARIGPSKTGSAKTGPGQTGPWRASNATAPPGEARPACRTRSAPRKWTRRRAPS
jgi:hypothetical protein